jgi:lysophospholipase-1
MVWAMKPKASKVRLVTFHLSHVEIPKLHADIARQFQSAGKLPYMTWVLPNALENHDLTTTAWYMPISLPPYAPSRPELEEDEDEEGMMQTVAYLTTLIDDLIKQGVPANRIVLGGFSQGHVMSMLTGLVSKYAGQLGGLVGVSGYMPLPDRIPALRQKAGLPQGVDDCIPVFLARGTADRLVPKRYHRICYDSLLRYGVKQDSITVKEYDGMGHGMNGAVLRDLCAWLEAHVPAI